MPYGGLHSPSKIFYFDERLHETGQNDDLHTKKTVTVDWEIFISGWNSLMTRVASQGGPQGYGCLLLSPAFFLRSLYIQVYSGDLLGCIPNV